MLIKEMKRRDEKTVKSPALALTSATVESTSSPAGAGGR